MGIEPVSIRNCRKELGMEIPKKGFTHAGRFHADDAFSTALLLYLNKDFTYERGFQVPKDFEGIVYDIGGGEFDHHQAGAPIRQNGVPYAAFGLLWREFGASILGVEDAANFDEQFIQPMDLSDNTGKFHEICSVTEAFNPTWDSDRPENEAFEEAVSFAGTILEKKFERIFAIRRAETMVRQAVEKAEDKIVVLKRSAPWKQIASPADVEYVVYPSQRGGYAAQGVPIEPEGTELKRPFPEEWRGADAATLARLSGVAGLRFCHKSGFLLTAETLEEAIACCKIAQQTAL